METFNPTCVPDDMVRELTVLKTGRNNWRNRNITLYQHPVHADRVISDGMAFDASKRVIADDAKAEWMLGIPYLQIPESTRRIALVLSLN